MITIEKALEDPGHLCARRIKGVIALGVLLSVSACAVTGRDHDDAAWRSEADTLWVPRDGVEGNESSASDKVGPTQAVASGYTVQVGDSLADIARRMTGASSNWQAIADYNDLENPDALRVGETVRVPPQLLADAEQQSTLEPGADQIGLASRSGVDLIVVLSEAQDYDADFQAAISSRSIAQRSMPIARSALLPKSRSAMPEDIMISRATRRMNILANS